MVNGSKKKRYVCLILNIYVNEWLHNCTLCLSSGMLKPIERVDWLLALKFLRKSYHSKEIAGIYSMKWEGLILTSSWDKIMQYLCAIGFPFVSIQAGWLILSVARESFITRVRDLNQISSSSWWSQQGNQRAGSHTIFMDSVISYLIILHIFIYKHSHTYNNSAAAAPRYFHTWNIANLYVALNKQIFIFMCNIYSAFFFLAAHRQNNIIPIIIAENDTDDD